MGFHTTTLLCLLAVVGAVCASRVTVTGKACNADDHGCGKHGYGYHWCWVGNSWDYCCPPDHECGRHGDGYNWCWTGNRDWNYCNRPDQKNYTRTVSGKTCKSGHYCAHHGYYYMWCYTDSSWDYCCQEQDSNDKNSCGQHNTAEKYNWCVVGKDFNMKCTL